MLSKIIKYEFKSTTRAYVVTFLSIIALTFLAALVQYVPDGNEFVDIMKNLLIIVYICIICAMPVGILLAQAVRFYRTMLGNTSYFTHTIPAKKSTLINAKLISSFLWEVITLVAMVVSMAIFMLILAVGSDIEEINRILNELSKLDFSVFSTYWSTILLGMVAVIVSIIVSIVSFYAAIALGQIIRGHKVLGAIIFMVVLRYLSSAIGMGTMFAGMYLLDYEIADSVMQMNVMMSLMIAATLVYGIICYIITYFNFKNFDLE